MSSDELSVKDEIIQILDETYGDKAYEEASKLFVMEYTKFERVEGRLPNQERISLLGDICSHFFRKKFC